MFRTNNSFFTLLTVALVAVFVTSVSYGGDSDFATGEDTRFMTSEVASAGQSWNLEGTAKGIRNMAFIPGGNNIFFDLTLSNSDGSTPAPTWDSVANLVTIDIDQSNPDAFDYVGTTNLSQALVNGDSTLRVSWDSTANPITSFAEATIFFGGHEITDENNAFGAQAGIDLTIETLDAFTTSELDNGGADDIITNFFKGDNFIDPPDVTATTATVDVNQDREGLLDDLEDSTSTDFGAIFTLEVSGNAPFNVDGTTFALLGGELNFVEAVFSDDAALGGITFFEGAGYDTAPDRITMTAGFDTSDRQVSITVTGDDTLETRTIKVTFTFSITQPDASVRIIVRGVGLTVSVWDLNGCVLLAHWLQGNTDAPDGSTTAGVFKSRLYLVNHTSKVGAVDLEVFQADRSNPPTTAPTSLGTTTPGSIPDLTANGALVVRLEDVLNDPAIEPNLNDGAGGFPHLENGGNLAVVVTIRTSDCSGSYQTFNEDVLSAFFGTANMTRID